MKEIYGREIRGFGDYRISNLGRVKRVNGGDGKISKVRYNRLGLGYVVLRRDGGSYIKIIAFMMIESFFERAFDYKVISLMFKDFDITNTTYDNLIVSDLSNYDLKYHKKRKYEYYLEPVIDKLTGVDICNFYKEKKSNIKVPANGHYEGQQELDYYF